MISEGKSLASRKLKTLEALCEIVGPRPAEGTRQQTVIMCHGTFDVVHPGHVRHLLYARSKADILVASLTCDAHVTKADLRPYVPEDLRAVNLAAFEMVDYVIIDRNPTPIETLKRLQPDYFAKGFEYGDGQIPPRTQEEIETLAQWGGEMIFTPGDVVYSSSRFIETAPPDLSMEKLLNLMAGDGFDFAQLYACLESFKGLHVHVIGDTIVDGVTRCSMIGGMTKTPTMSVRHEEQHHYVGGAGIVAKHFRAAGAEVTFSTVLGADSLADYVRKDLQDQGIQLRDIEDRTRPTTLKNAFVAGGYRLLKVDTLDNRPISDRILEQFVEAIRSVKADLVVFSDFRHGIFNPQTLPALTAALPTGTFRVADSQVASRWGNILEFQDFDLITPNEREARFALGDQDSVVRPLASRLFEQARCRTLILKLGEKGVLTYRSRPEGDPRTIISLDSFARKVSDAVGAGDALLAYAALALFATGGNEAMAAVLGSLAAGLECEIDGNCAITPDALNARLREIEAQALWLAPPGEAQPDPTQSAPATAVLGA